MSDYLRGVQHQAKQLEWIDPTLWQQLHWVFYKKADGKKSVFFEAVRVKQTSYRVSRVRLSKKASF